jgi:hypothetical protein
LLFSMWPLQGGAVADKGGANGTPVHGSAYGEIAMPEQILPGTYITVRDEGLITAGRVVSGNIGIVGTASKGPVGQVQILGSFSEAREIFGENDPWTGGTGDELTLIRALEFIYNNGGRTVYAVRTAGDTAASAAYQTRSGAKLLTKLLARTPGTWGNAIRIDISEAGEEDTKKVELTHGADKETYFVTSASGLAQQVNSRSRLVFAAGDDENGFTELPDDTNGPKPFEAGANGEAATVTDYRDALALLENELVNIVVLAGQDASNSEMVSALLGHINTTAEIRRERIAVLGSNGTDDLSAIAGHSLNSERVIFTAPGIQVAPQVKLPGAYTAAAVAGLLSSLPVQSSPTNKPLNIPGVSKAFSSSQLEKLVMQRVLAVEKRDGYRIVKGITTSTNTAWHQITTRRIVDYALYGVRSACNPYIGKLNNDRVRGALKATIDAFLTRMVESEALVGYELEVTATRAQQIAGECIVTMTIQPTFSIDFIVVTMYLG